MAEIYRQLTDTEIQVLENNGCRAESWATVKVAGHFMPHYIKNATFYGNIYLGVFEKEIETGSGFRRHCGIYNATLRNVKVGDNSLIENIGNHINNYEIGKECHICNTGIIETTPGATFGNGNIISVLNEAGNGNIVIFDKLTSNIAALTANHPEDTELTNAMTRLVMRHIISDRSEYGKIGNYVKIVNTTEIVNTLLSDKTEISGAYRLNECSIAGSGEACVRIGTGVTCENTVIASGSSVLNNVILENCFVGEACCIKNGFSAENCVFFANTYMSNGEACAAFCGPFTASHHKSSLLIGGMFSFYNAGSATNFSNHAYKMGPVHYGTLNRGCKTASGAHILHPAHIGAFSMCMGKISCHPDTRHLPFSYIISDNGKTFIAPARNIITVGLYRDIHKWERRDMRSQQGKASIVNFDWLSPFTMSHVLKGKGILEKLLEEGDKAKTEHLYNGCIIRTKAIEHGIMLYEMAIKMFLGDTLVGNRSDGCNHIGEMNEWCDLSGLIIPAKEEERLIGDIKNNVIKSIDELLERLKNMHYRYMDYKYLYAKLIAKIYYNLDTEKPENIMKIRSMYAEAKSMWLDEIEKDAMKEFSAGDVGKDVLDSFLGELATARTGIDIQ